MFVEPAKIQPALEVDNIDTAVNPGDDFYQYAVGSWLKRNPIPEDYSRWGSFEILQERNFIFLRDIMERPEQFAGTALATLANKVADFYASGMKEDRVESDGMNRLQPALQSIAAINDRLSLASCIGFLHTHYASPLFSIHSTPDAKNSAMVITGLSQGGLGLPDRDYYLTDEANFVEARRRYAICIERMFRLAGRGNAVESARAILAIETHLAHISSTKEDLRDPIKNYHKMTKEQLCKLAPVLDWETYFSAIEFSHPGDLDVGQTSFFEGFTVLFKELSWADWKTYLTWHVLLATADFLGRALAEERFAFYGVFLAGQKKMKPRWKRVAQVMEETVGMAVGQLYVEKHFSSSAREHMFRLISYLVAAMHKRIEGLPWMQTATKHEALAKLKAMHFKIGYPNKWVDYTNLHLTNDSYLENVKQAHYFEFKRDIAKIGKPVDPEEWHMPPQMINAYYDQLKNEMVFPAGILQPPFFNNEADDAVNYGAIGAVIGHEMTHGFDDQGRKYDATGTVRDWWTPVDEAQFHERSRRLVEQFNAYVPIDTIHVNGEFTLGENIADLGGVQVAYDALEKALQNNNRKPIDGFTPEQRFFLAWAEGWKNNIREELVRLYLAVDPHSPGRFRVNGPLSNLPAFFEAFEACSGQAMYRPEEERVIIW